MTSAADKLGRARYLIKRLTESPPLFLARKASIELNKRLDRRGIVRAVDSGTHFSLGYEQEASCVLQLARSIRSDLLTQAGRAGITSEASLSAFSEQFDAHRISCLGYGETSLEPGGWAHDAFHDFTWPNDYFASIDYVASDWRCDVKVPWEKSRLQWLSRAALADAIDTNEGRRRARLERIELLLDDWLSENPYGIGVNWVSAMEVAIRAVNMLTSLVSLVDRFEDGMHSRLLCSLGEHLHYLRRYPETSDVQGNHHLATELGIFFLEAFRRGTGNSDHAAATFAKASHEQFTTGGLHVEFAPIYHRLTLDMVSLGHALMQRVSPTFAKTLEPCLLQARTCCARLANSSGELPLFGDHDSGHVLDFGQATRVPMEVAVHTARDRSSKIPEHGALAISVWQDALRGFECDLSRWGQSEQPPAEGSRTQLSTFTILERDEAKLILRAGPHGLAGRASHDHEDQLSFWYSFAGRDLVVEAGCPPYTRDGVEREAGVSSLAHNVISMKGEPRHHTTLGSVCATVRGAPIAQLVKDHAQGECAARFLLSAPDHGASAGCPLGHERYVELDESGCATIIDQVQARSGESFGSLLHFAPGHKLERDGAGAYRLLSDDGTARLSIVCSASVPFECLVEAYDHHPEYGLSIEASRLLMQGRCETEFEVRIQLRPLTQEGDA
ncbi:MAG: hypothetical protein ACI841_003531 [Planctomycetota bacterium]|jgi:hypothetical protein